MACQGVAGTCDSNVNSARIAVAGGSITEILYFLGAEDRIAAVDTTSIFPPQAKAFPSVGYVRALSAEGLLSVRPTLILCEQDMGPPNVLTQVAGTGVSIIQVPEAHTADGILRKIRCVASILGLSTLAHSRIAETLTPTVTEINALRASATAKPRAALILDTSGGSLVAAGTGTSGTGLLDVAGAENLFTSFSGWKPVSAEAILKARPDFVIVALTQPDSNASLNLLPRASEDGSETITLDAVAALGFGPRTLNSALDLALAFKAQASK